MTKGTATRIVTRLALLGVPVELYEGYSGRGMCGVETWAVTAADRTRARMAEDKSPTLRHARKDSLGLGVVWY